jgi:hypothetical protein
LWISTVSATFVSGGCFSGSNTSGKPINEKTVKMIQPDKTTKDEIIQWFGPPQSIEKPGGKDETAAKEEKVKTMRYQAWPGGGLFHHLLNHLLNYFRQNIKLPKTTGFMFIHLPNLK